MSIRKTIVASLLVMLTGVGAHAAVVVSKDSTISTLIPGLTGFSTTGAEMDGLRVTASFADGFTETLAWADTGPTSGGVSGTGWSLSLTGDTFTSPWTFALSDVRQLSSLVLDATGFGQVTIFDTTNPSPGTPDSAQGADFAILAGCGSCDGTAVYTHAVGIDPNAPVGDLFHRLTITFDAGTGPRTDFTFRQDTDNDVRLRTGFVPEPTGLALIALGLLAGAAAMRRRRS